MEITVEIDQGTGLKKCTKRFGAMHVSVFLPLIFNNHLEKSGTEVSATWWKQFSQISWLWLWQKLMLSKLVSSRNSDLPRCLTCKARRLGLTKSSGFCKPDRSICHLLETIVIVILPPGGNYSVKLWLWIWKKLVSSRNSVLPRCLTWRQGG